MKQGCIIVDVDNTIIATAERKYSLLLQEHADFRSKISLEEVKNDYSLKSVFGTSESRISKSFFEKLDTPEVIETHPANIMNKADEVIKYFQDQKIRIIILSARPHKLLDATFDELTKNNITINKADLYLYKDNTKSIKTFKYDVIENLKKTFEVIAMIGDRKEDMEAAVEAKVRSIFFISTHSLSEIEKIANSNPAGHQSVSTWLEIKETIETFMSGIAEIRRFREQSILQYSAWLSDIDNKCRIHATISGILCALSGSILNVILSNANWNRIDYVLFFIIICALLSAFLSILFALRSITSLVKNKKISIRRKMRQGAAILLNSTHLYKHTYLPDDPIDQWEKMKNQSITEQAYAHYEHFYEKYQTYDTEALSNHRYFSVRASNQSKVYAERFSSSCLIISIILLALWVIIGAFI